MLYLVLVVNALFALVFTLGKITLQFAPPFFITGMRMIVGGSVITGFCIATGARISQKLNREAVKMLALLAVFNIFFANAFEFWGLQYMGSAKACLIYNLSPFFSSLFAYVYFRETMTVKKILGLIIGMFGFIPVFLNGSVAETNLPQFGIFSTAEISLIIATIATVYGWIIMQKLIRTGSLDEQLANGVSMIAGGFLALVASLFAEAWHPFPVAHWWPFTGWLILIVLCSNIICFPLYTQLLKKYSATFMALSGFTGPIFAAIFDWLFLGIGVSWDFYLAMITVSLGMFFFYQEDVRQGYSLH